MTQKSSTREVSELDWLSRLESTSESYANRFRSSRRLAGPDNVVDLQIMPGHVSGRIVDRHGELHNVDISVRQLSPGEQQDVVDAITGRAQWLAAMLDGEIPVGLLGDLVDLEVNVLPSPSDLRPDCDCDEYAEPCVHAGALMIALNRSFESDPFALFKLRGLPRDELMSRIRQARSILTSATAEPGPLSNTSTEQSQNQTVNPVDPWDAWSASRPLGPPPVAESVETVDQSSGEDAWVHLKTPLVSNVSSDSGTVLDELRRDAADRAASMLSSGTDSMLNSSQMVDLARLLGSGTWQGHHVAAARAAGMSISELDALVDAFKQGGQEAVTTLFEPATWSVDQEMLAGAREDLVDAGFDKREVALNYNSLGVGRDHLLVRSPSGHWYLLSESRLRKPRRIVRGPMDYVSEIGKPEALGSD